MGYLGYLLASFIALPVGECYESVNSIVGRLIIGHQKDAVIVSEYDLMDKRLLRTVRFIVPERFKTYDPAVCPEFYAIENDAVEYAKSIGVLKLLEVALNKLGIKNLHIKKEYEEEVQ